MAVDLCEFVEVMIPSVEAREATDRFVSIIPLLSDEAKRLVLNHNTCLLLPHHPSSVVDILYLVREMAIELYEFSRKCKDDSDKTNVDAGDNGSDSVDESHQCKFNYSPSIITIARSAPTVSSAVKNSQGINGDFTHTKRELNVGTKRPCGQDDTEVAYQDTPCKRGKHDTDMNMNMNIATDITSSCNIRETMHENKYEEEGVRSSGDDSTGDFRNTHIQEEYTPYLQVQFIQDCVLAMLALLSKYMWRCEGQGKNLDGRIGSGDCLQSLMNELDESLESIQCVHKLTDRMVDSQRADSEHVTHTYESSVLKIHRMYDREDVLNDIYMMFVRQPR